MGGVFTVFNEVFGFAGLIELKALDPKPHCSQCGSAGLSIQAFSGLS